MKKVLLFIIMLFVSINIVQARKEIPNEIIQTINGYIKNVNNQNLKALDFIDEDNEKLIDFTKDNINGLELKYSIDDYQENSDGSYKVVGTISAKGTNFEINGFKVEFLIKQDANDNYVILKTDLFDVIDGKNIFKFVVKVFGIMFGIFIIIAIISTIIIVINVKKNKQRLEQKS